MWLCCSMWNKKQVTIFQKQVLCYKNFGIFLVLLCLSFITNLASSNTRTLQVPFGQLLSVDMLLEKYSNKCQQTFYNIEPFP